LKKIIILLLCVSLLHISVPVYAATDASNDSIEVLRAVGVINSGKEIVPENGISRGDFVALASRIALQGSLPLGTSVVFSDVSSQNENFDAINLLSSLGIVSGNPNGMFLPDEIISQKEAAKIVINSLDWDEFIISDKNDTLEYFGVAVRNKFFRGIEADSEAKMTWAEAAELFMNVLSSNVRVQVSYGDTEEYQKYSDVTYFNLYFDVYTIEGRVTDNGATSLSGKSRIDKGSFLIDGISLVDMREKKTDLLGMNVEAYYKKIKGKQDELIYAVPDDDQLLTLTSNMIYGFEDNVYYYSAEENDEYEYEAKLLKEFDLIYNGKAVLPGETVDLAKLHPESGRVELIDADGDSKYETVKLWVYRSVVVSSKDEERFMIYDKLGGVPICADEAEGCIITDKNGNTMSFAQIKPMDVLSVSVSSDNELVSIICNKSGFNARIDECINGSTYLLSGVEYRPSDDFMKVYKEQLKIGTYADFYANHEGLLVYMDTSSEPGAGLAYLVDVSTNKDGFNDDYLVKLFTSNGKMRVYRLAQKVTVDGVGMSSKDAYAMIWNGGNVKNQLLDYTLDGEESINMLDLAYDGAPSAKESDYSLHFHGAITKDRDKSIKMKYIFSAFDDGRVFINPSTLVFLIPNNGDEEDFIITDQSYFRDNTEYTIKDAYRHDPESPLAEAIVMNVDHTGKQYYHVLRPASLVKSVSNAVNSNGDIVQKLVCYENGSTVTVYTEEDNVLQVVSNGKTVKIAPGDIIRYGTNSKGTISKNDVIMLYDTDKPDELVTQGSFAGTVCMYMGYAYIRSDNFLRMAKQATEIDEEKNLFNCDISSGKVIVVSEDRNGYSFRTGTVDDIMDYKSVGGDCSKVFIYTWSGKPRMIVVYD